MRLGQVRVVWFAHRPDMGCLRWSVSQALAAFPAGTTFHVYGDGRMGGLHPYSVRWLLQRGVHYQDTVWERGGNLNGIPAVLGILEAMHEAARSPWDVVLKVDADTLVGDPGTLLDWFQADPNLTGAGLRNPFAPGWWGISYALRAAAIRPLAAIIEAGGIAGLGAVGLTAGHEDLVISRTLAQHEAEARLRTWMTRRTGGAFSGYSYQRSLDARQALQKWGIVTFGNRWQIEGDDAHRRQIVAKTMRQARAGWSAERARGWRSRQSETLWGRGVLLRFGKSSQKGGSKVPKSV